MLLKKETNIYNLQTTPELTQQQIDNCFGMHQLVNNSISNCDIDLRPLLFNNVVVTGGNTLFPGFNERLNYELPMLAPGVSFAYIITMTQKKKQ